MSQPLWCYLDPTGGLPPTAWAMFLAALVSGMGVLLGVVKLGARRVRGFLANRRAVILFGSVLVVGLLMSLWWLKHPGKREETSANGPRVLVLAFDGLDPHLLDRYLTEGRLPNFRRLAEEGIYHPLATSKVPQSPVAWSTFITGVDPTRHGVFDFIRRDPETYKLDLSLADRRRLALPWQGTPLWERPTIARLGFTAQRLPMVFPPPKLNGRLLAGMGVWDVRGTEGTYFFFSTHPAEHKDARGKILPLKRAGGLLLGELPGPYRAGKPDDIREPFELDVQSETARLRIQRSEYELSTGRWSDWIGVEFSLGPLGLQKLAALTKVLFRKDGDRVSLYVSPLQFDPRSPFYPVAQPAGYSAELADAIGLYATRGMPFDSQAVAEGLLSDEDFLEQVRQITVESEKMLAYELSRFESGILFGYFGGGDMVQHVFWRGIDPQHPLYADEETKRHRDAIPQLYEQYDAILGRARAALGQDGQVVVLSDHGFGPYRRSVHLNSVLRDFGFLVVRDGKKSSGEFFAGVDWGRTRAYAAGFNAVYLNLAGREGKGIVAISEAERTARALAEKLASWQDPETGERPIKQVYVSDTAVSAGHRDMPDLMIGYYRGYRASWETALGAAPEKTAEPNRKKWSGDHCFDASEVPGVFLSSDPALNAAGLAEVGAVLDQYLASRTLSKQP